MTSKKFGIVVIVVIVAGITTIYGMDELVPPVITRISGDAQYVDLTFGERVEKASIVLEGKVSDVRIKVFAEEIMETDENGNRVVLETLQIPRAEVTIEVEEVLKGDHELDSKAILVYDREVSDAIGTVNGEKARFISQNAYDYQVGESGIFLIENDGGLWIDGFTSFYPIEHNKSTIESEFYKKYGKEPMKLEDAKDIISLKAEE